MRINPRVRFVEPNAKMSVLTPARSGGRDGLLRWVLGEEFRGRSELKVFVSVMFFTREAKVLLAVRRVANQCFKELGTFKPPMAEQLRIERRHDDRIEIEGSQIVELLPPRAQEMRGMRIGNARRHHRLVRFLFAIAISDAVVLDAGEFSQRRSLSGPDMFEGKFKADVAIKFPIRRITRIPFRCAPDLPARIAIARKRGGPGRGKAGRVNRAARPWLAEHQAVGVDDEPAQVRFPQDILNAGMISAFGQPKPVWIGVKCRPIRIATDENLRANRFGRLLEQWEQTMRRGGGHEFEAAVVAQSAKHGEQIAIPI